MAQVIVPQSRKEDALTTLMKGLQIASQVYGIRADMRKIEEFDAQKKLAEQDRAAAQAEKQRVVEGRVTPVEKAALAQKFELSRQVPKGVEATKFSDEQGDFYAYTPRPAPEAPKQPDVVAVETVDESGSPIVKFVKKEQGVSYPRQLTSSQKPTKDQFTAAAFGKRVESANDIFEKLEDEGYNRGSRLSGLSATILPSAFQGSSLKQQEQAERNFVNAVLRRESGAAISESEFENAQNQYFPRAGDTPEVLAQKRQNRLQAAESLKAEAGNAWEQVPKVQLASPKKEPEEGVAIAAEAPKPSPEDLQAMEWVKKNPKDPRADQILKSLRAKGL